MKEKKSLSLETTLSLAKVVKIGNPKNILIDNDTLLKFKNIVTDYQELSLSPTKLINAIVLNWLEEHREELLLNHITKASSRY